MEEEAIRITVSGPPTSGKSAICGMIYDSLVSNGINRRNIRYEDDQFYMPMDTFMERVKAIKHSNREIIIESQQTKRNV